MLAYWARLDCENGCNIIDAWIVPTLGQGEHTQAYGGHDRLVV